MYNLLIAFGAGAVVFVLGAAVFGPFAGILPGLLVFVAAQFLLGRRTGTAIQAELAGLEPLLQGRKIDEAVALLRRVQATYKPWQFLLDQQIEAQIGILDYLQMKFDDARPRLEAGGKGPFTWTAFGRNPLALALLACLHYRQGRKDERGGCSPPPPRPRPPTPRSTRCGLRCSRATASAPRPSPPSPPASRRTTNTPACSTSSTSWPTTSGWTPRPSGRCGTSSSPRTCSRSR
jgi:hypothetical protein